MIKSFIGGYYASDNFFCLNSSLQTNVFIIWFSKLLYIVISICKLWSNKILSLPLSLSLSDASDVAVGVLHRLDWASVDFTGPNAWIAQMSIAWRELYAVGQ